MGHKIACIGEAMIELSIAADFKIADVGFAGDTLNTAIYMRRAMSDADEVAFVSVIGRDENSDRMAEFVASEGVSTKALLRHDNRTAGIYSISTDSEGERSFSYWRDNSAARTLFQTDDGVSFEILEQFDTIYYSAITLAILPQNIRDALFDWIVGYRARGGVVAFDSNYRPKLWQSQEEAQQVIAKAWSHCDIALPSVDDEIDVFGDADAATVLARIQSYGVLVGALKQGAAGPVPINAPHNLDLRFLPAERVVDTTAAGDSFVGAFLASYLIDGDLDTAMVKGHDCAARVVGYRGAIIPKGEA